jgi:hypothetical protein
MKTMLFAAATVLSLGVGSAYANENGAQSGGYVYPDYQFPAQSAPSVAAAPRGHATHAYVANSNHGTWVFPPDQTSDGTSG